MKFTVLLSVAMAFFAVSSKAYPTDYYRQFLVGQLQNYEYVPMDQYMRSSRGFDSLKLGGSFGTSKRNQQIKNKQHRRGTFDSLVLGNSFGRVARAPNSDTSETIQYHANHIKLTPEEQAQLFNFKRSTFDSLNMKTFGGVKRNADETDVETSQNRSLDDVAVIQEQDYHNNPIKSQRLYMKK